MGIYEQYPTAKWEVEGKSFTFAVVSCRERMGNRIAKHRRLYRPGARCDNTGPDAREWHVRGFFFNDPDQEPGIDGAAQYPDNLNAILDSFDAMETGTLTTPTRGPRRCKAESYDRMESNDARDAATVDFVWVEDNEDDAAVAAAMIPSAASVLASLAVEATVLSTDAGAWSDPLSSLEDFAADLVGLIEAPGEFVSDLEAKANAFQGRIGQIEDAFATETERATTEAQTLLTDPEASLAGRRLRELADTVARATGQKGDPFARAVVGVRYARRLSLFDVAADLGQDPAELMALNPGLPDALDIEPGTLVQVFDAA